MGDKMKTNEYNLAYDNLAIPEVHIGKKNEEKENDDIKPSVSYDALAIPEIHIKKK